MSDISVSMKPSSVSATPQPSDAHARAARQRTLVDARRTLILEAAQAVFFERGMEGTSMREIARRAGYTPGALYSYFESKEDLYGALLSESLDRLNADVDSACADCHDPVDTATAAAQALFDFYYNNPRDLDLGFYLFQGMQPRGLTSALDRHLNKRLRDALTPVQQGLETMGMPNDQALKEVTALFAHAVGLLLLNHTGRIRMFRQQSTQLFQEYLAQLVVRAGRGKD